MSNYVKYNALVKNNVPKELAGVVKPYDLHCPVIEIGKGQRTVVLLLERVLSEDLAKRRISSTGVLEQLIRNMLAYASSVMPGLQDVGDLIVMPLFNWNTHSSDSDIMGITTRHTQRVLSELAGRKGVSSIVISGHHTLLGDLVNAVGEYASYNIYGVPTKALPVPVTMIPSLAAFIEDDHVKGNGPSNVLGYASRCLGHGCLGENPWALPRVKFKVNMVNTLKEFDQMLAKIKKAPIVCIDTETDSLNRVNVKMQTIQFAVDNEDGKPIDSCWIVPFAHKMSPFKQKDREYIAKKLKQWHQTCSDQVHVYHNAKFDLSVQKANFGVRYFAAPLWDVMNAEFALDENHRFLVDSRMLTRTHGGYYSMANVAAQYGCFFHSSLGFGKSDRANFKNADIYSHDVQQYAGADVVVPLLIRRQELRRAKAARYDNYGIVVTGLESDKGHSFAEMETTGIPFDAHYMMYLKSDESPIQQTIKSAEAAIYNAPEVKRLNDKMLKEQGLPSVGLFGVAQVFNIKKDAHAQRLMFKELKLKPLRETANGGGSLDKAFKQANNKVPIVAQLEQIDKAAKLLNSFVSPNIVRLAESGSDLAYDMRIRPSMDAVNVVTGRISESDPNMQQIPNRGDGKHIKRCFIAPQNHLVVKIDFSAHEVRGWAIVSNDAELGEVFAVGYRLRIKYRINPSGELAELIFLKGDSHRLNVEYFFQVDLKKLKEKDPAKLKDLRDQIKGIIFGLIYGKMAKTLARDLKVDLHIIEKLVDKLFSRFPRASKWLTDTEKFAKKNLYVEAPTGRRRNLFHYLLPQSSEYARLQYGAADRKARNSPIQGMGSDFNFQAGREMKRRIFEFEKKHGFVPVQQMNVVHDSNETLVNMDAFWWGIRNLHESMTDAVQDIVLRRHGLKFVVPLEIEMELGAHYSALEKWEWDVHGLLYAAANGFVVQQRELGYDVDPLAKLKSLVKNRDHNSDWMEQQIKNVGLPNLKQLVAKAEKSFQPSAYRLARSK